MLCLILQSLKKWQKDLCRFQKRLKKVSRQQFKFYLLIFVHTAAKEKNDKRRKPANNVRASKENLIDVGPRKKVKANDDHQQVAGKSLYRASIHLKLRPSS